MRLRVDPIPEIIGPDGKGNYNGQRRFTELIRGIGHAINSIGDSVLGWADVRDYPSINAAVASIGSTLKTLAVSNTQTLTATLTIPANIHLVILEGGSIVKASTYTLTIDGPIDAGIYPVFSGFSAGDVRLGGAIAKWFAGTDYSALQQAVSGVLAYGGGFVHVTKGTYNFLAGETLSIVNSNTKAFRLYGDGQHVTILQGANDVNAGLVDVNSTGPVTEISGMAIQPELNASRAFAIRATGNGMLFKDLWLVAAYGNGLHLNAVTNTRVTDVLAELCGIGFLVEKSYAITLENIHTYQNIFSGVKVTGQVAVAGSEKIGALSFSNLSLVEDGVGGDASGASFYIDGNTPTNISNIEIMSYNNAWPQIGVRIESGAGDISIANPSISHCKIAGIKNNAVSNLTVIGGKISWIGYYDQTVPWAVYGIWHAGNAGRLTVVGVSFVDIAGYGIYTEAVDNQIISSVFQRVARGGFGETEASATTGRQMLYLNPLASYFHAVVVGNHFINSPLSATNRTGIYIGNTAIPGAEFIKLIGNDYAVTEIATPFATAMTAAQLNTQYIRGNNMLPDSAVAISTYADANAPNSTLYFSSTASRLVWKDSIGNINNLY